MAHAQIVDKRFPIAASDVANALETAGMSVTPESVQLLVPVSASAPAPRLTLASHQPAGAGRHRLRLACETTHICLPFYALVTAPDALWPAKESENPRSSSSPSLPIRSVAAALHAGEHATLLLEDRVMRISLPVVVIDTGKLGAEVRVASLDRKQMYRGRVWDDGTVHGDLP